MRKVLTILGLMLFSSSPHANAQLIPTDKNLPPLAMTAHHVAVTIDEQVAVTRIEQTFHNHTDRQLEATYYLPVPRGASVKRFSMWVDGTEVVGELVEANKARQIYNDIVRRTLDPGLLEYMDSSLLKMRIFPVPPKGDQKIALSYTSVGRSENNLVEFVYPMRSAENRQFVQQDKFSLNITMKSQFPLQNIYSPSHGITMSRKDDRSATIAFAKNQAVIDRDFQLFYHIGTGDVGLNTLATRSGPSSDGHFMMLVSPRIELSKSQQIPRDMVFVLDTSGSMRGKRMTQARNALKYCLQNLAPEDRFGLMNFASTVNRYSQNLLPATQENLAAARKWVDALEATGGTDIDGAMSSAFDMRSSDETRPFNIVFFTDGRPTVGEITPVKILANVARKMSANTRIFTFGVGDDVNATMLDAMAENSRGISTFVRENEEIEAKTSGLFARITSPVLSNLALSVSGDVKLNEVYPPKLPDLFHGTQLVVFGRYNGKGGKTSITLTGMVGKDRKEFTYEVNFPEQTTEERPFVEELWARRRVGYVLDQIRTHGETKELVDEVVSLAKRYGITTPYTSYLVVPDGPLPSPMIRPFLDRPGVVRPAALEGAGAKAGEQGKVADFAKDLKDGGGAGKARGTFEQKQLDMLAAQAQAAGAPEGAKKSIENAQRAMALNKEAKDALGRRELDRVQGGQLGVDLSVQSGQLRNQTNVTRSASKFVQNRNCIDIGGVWIDDGFDAKMPSVVVKAMSEAYFRILQLQPNMREVFQLGNYLIWVTPSGTVLIIDQNDGREAMPDADIERLFRAPGK